METLISGTDYTNPIKVIRQDGSTDTVLTWSRFILSGDEAGTRLEGLTLDSRPCEVVVIDDSQFKISATGEILTRAP